MRRRSRRPPGPRPSIAEPRPHLLQAVLAFVRAARACPGVRGIALIGSLTTEKAVPKDADLLVTLDGLDDLAPLARVGRSLMGEAQHINLGADIFLADAEGCYVGRICGYRECFRRVLCKALNCGVRQHLNDDLQIVTLPAALIATPPLELWPRIVRRVRLPSDVEQQLLAPLAGDEEGSGTGDARA